MNKSILSRPVAGETMNDHDEMISADAARYLGVSRERISALVREKRLVGRVVAGRVRIFTRAELDAYRITASTNKGGRPRKYPVFVTDSINVKQ